MGVLLSGERKKDENCRYNGEFGLKNAVRVKEKGEKLYKNRGKRP